MIEVRGGSSGVGVAADEVSSATETDPSNSLSSVLALLSTWWEGGPEPGNCKPGARTGRLGSGVVRGGVVRGMADGKTAPSPAESRPSLSAHPHRYSPVACTRARWAFLSSCGLTAPSNHAPCEAITRRTRSGRPTAEPASMASAQVRRTWFTLSWSSVARSPWAMVNRAMTGMVNPYSCAVVAAAYASRFSNRVTELESMFGR